MKRRRFTGLALASAAVVTTQGMPRLAQAQSLRLTGAGASFPFPLYSTWFQTYSAGHPASRSTTSRPAAVPA